MMSTIEALHRSPGRPRSVEADRAIGEAVVDLLIERGYGEVTMEGVATRAGVAKTTIYRRWPTKALMVVESICGAGKNCPIEAVCCDGTIRSTLIGHLQGLSSSRVTKIITGLAVEMPHNPELAEAVREGLLTPNRAVMMAVLQEGVTSGELRPDIDLQLTADLLVSPIFFRLLVSGAPVGPELAAATVDSVLNGVLAPPGCP